MLELKAYGYTTISLIVGLICFQWCADRRLSSTIGKHFLILALVTQAAAFMSPDVVVYNVVAGIVLFAACMQRRMIAPTYLFLLTTLPMTPKVIAAGGTYIMSYDVGISLGIAAMIALAARAKGRFPRSLIWDVPVFLLFLLFVIANGRSTTATNMMRVTLEQASILLLPYFVVSRSMRSFEDVRDAFYGLVAGATAMSTLALYESLHTWPLYRIVSQHYGIVLGGDASVKVRAGFLRSSGPFTEPTSFGFCLALGMLAAIGCRRLFGSGAKRAIVLMVLTIGILAPQSRGGWFGLALGIVAMDLYDRRYGALARKIGIAAVGIVAIFAAAQVDQRIASTAGLNAEGQGTVDYRSNLFDRGVDEIKAHPLTGRTVADVQYAMRDMRQGEGIIDFVNTYLFVGLIAGIPGLLVFFGALATPTFAIWRAPGSFAHRHLAMFRRLSSASLVFGSLAAVMLMIAVTSMTGRTTVLVVIQIGFASVIMNNMRAARRGMKRQSDAEAASVDDPLSETAVNAPARRPVSV